MVNLSKMSLKPRKVCCIDASTNSLAFAIFDGDKLYKFGKIKFDGINTYSKIRDAARKSVAFFKTIKDDVDSIVIEHTVFLNSPKTQADLALFRVHFLVQLPKMELLYLAQLIQLLGKHFLVMANLLKKKS